MGEESIHQGNNNKTHAHIEKYGHTVNLVEATDYLPSFAYSIGLWQKFQHPEIICFGLQLKTLHALINEVADLVKGGQHIETDKIYTEIFENSRAEFLKVDSRNLSDYFGSAINFYRSKDFPALQLVWTDEKDIFPWEHNFNVQFFHRQPLLDRNADFKFREDKQLGVFTTREWLERNQPIMRVVHDTESDWQFLTKTFKSSKGKLVALEQLILKDKSLNEVFDLEYGEEAERDFVGGPWKRRRMGRP